MSRLPVGMLLGMTVMLLTFHAEVGKANPDVATGLTWLKGLLSSSKAEEAHETVNNENNPQQHKSSWTHELIAGAAGWEAMRAYERHQAKGTGQAVSHSHIKGVLAGLAAAAVDRLIETKGLDWIDAQRVKTQATRQAESVVAEKFGLNLNSTSGGDEYR